MDAPGVRGTQKTTPVRVLVMEDDALVGLMFGEVLEELGHAVSAIAATHPYAVAAARIERPDLMIVDVHLRGGSGISAVAEICETGFVPHVFFTGDIAEVIQRRPGAVALQKPFDEAALARAIAEALAARPWLASLCRTSRRNGKPARRRIGF